MPERSSGNVSSTTHPPQRPSRFHPWSVGFLQSPRLSQPLEQLEQALDPDCVGARETVSVPIPCCGDYVVRRADRHCLIDCGSWHRVERRVV
ncbi:hypothetical protein CDV36_012703 [Fusarium kuroshium]|uniref:Uncharacterized protein n=2 Tax=Fusarium solani species complex TaxID=232080 RepID=A0A3M2RR72_9HYPO|nr:hypothetical protein CDV36_012703 [Fusarium kuroshium]RSL82151.1 hypothetical protein CEP51_005361 [Fusarium floridanum]